MGFQYSVYYISIEQEVAYFPIENYIEIIVSSRVIMSNYLVPVSSQNCKGLRHCPSHMPANPVLASGTEFVGGGCFLYPHLRGGWKQCLWAGEWISD